MNLENKNFFYLVVFDEASNKDKQVIMSQVCYFIYKIGKKSFVEVNGS
jgi:hypothetical protein